MAIRAEWVQYGRVAAEALKSLIATTKVTDPLAPVTVVVASNHIGVATRRLLASGEIGAISPDRPGLVAVDFLTPFRLAEIYGSSALAAQGRLPVSTPVITAAIRACLSESPGLFAPVAAHSATEEALVGIFRELREVSPDSLDRLSRTGRRPAEVVRLFRAARDRLVEGWYDEQDLAEAAASVLRESTAELGKVIVYLPQRLSSSMARLISAVSLDHEVVVVAGCVGYERADFEVVQAVRRLGLGDSGATQVSGGVPANPFEAKTTEILTASDADEEVREAVRRVVDALRSGARADRVAVLYAGAEPYSRLVHEHLRAAGIPANGAAVVPLRERVAPRNLLSLVALAEGGFARREVMGWLTSAPVLEGHSPVPASSWERLARAAGVVKGGDQWDRRLTDLADGLTADATRLDEESNGTDSDEATLHRAERARRQADLAQRLRSFVVDLIDRVEAATKSPARWSDRAAWAKALMTDLFGPVEIGSRGWPPDEVKGHERLWRALDRLAALDRVEGPVEMSVFIRTLELELDADLGRVGRLGEGVLVGSVGMGVGLDLDLLAVVGLAEGSYPAPVRDDSLLADHERATVPGGELPLRRDAVGRQHHQFLAAAASSRQAVLCMPRGDLRATTQRMPSRWLLDAAAAVTGHRVSSGQLQSPGGSLATNVASFAAGLGQAADAATEQERRLQELLVDPSAFIDARYQSGRRMLAARRSRSFTRFDGDLSAVAVHSPTDQVVSATRLESWVACPHAYFMRYVLGLRDLDDPSEESRITPMDRGSLVHAALERFVSEAPPGRRRWDDTDRARMAAIGSEVCAEYESRGLTGRPLYWTSDRRQILSELDRFITEDIRLGVGDTSWPVAAELEFKDARLRLPDGRELRLQGMIDRIDTDDRGRVVVIDYKTGNAAPYRRLDTTDPGGGGAHLQLVIYALAARHHLDARDVSAYYWMVSAQGGWGRYGYRVDDEVVTKVAATVAQIVEGIERGIFPAHPTRSSTSPRPNCDYCDLDGLGETDLRRAWERKRDDPALAIYRSLVEPADG